MTYVPPHFTQEDHQEITAFLRAYPLATLVVVLHGELHPTPVPLIHRPGDDGWGTLIGHVAKANPMWQADSTTDALAIFGGPNGYISPNWYASKAEHHRVVPTWNYAAVHAWGPLTVHHESKWKRMAVGLLTQISERSSKQPWKMGDAPQEYLADQLEHIVGIEVPIQRLVAKWKMSQNRDEADRLGVIAGLGDRNQGNDAAMRTMMNATKGE